MSRAQDFGFWMFAAAWLELVTRNANKVYMQNRESLGKINSFAKAAEALVQSRVRQPAVSLDKCSLCFRILQRLRYETQVEQI